MRERKDFFYRKAKQQDYHARSAFKLAEMDEKFRLFHPGQTILDLGTSPGSWVQYIQRKLGSRVAIVGIDCLESKVSEGPTFHFVKSDILSAEPESLRALYPAYDAVVSDAAPNTSGNRFLDATRSIELCRAAQRLATALLRPGGFLVSKVFQGPDVSAFQRDLKKEYESVRLFKPKGSRKESVEIYVVALNFGSEKPDKSK